MTLLYVNGRFLTQPLTGVQRFAREVCRALARPAVTLAPPATPATPLFEFRRVGRLSGHAWEQFDLPRFTKGVLLNLGNTAPLALRRQVVVIHDARPFTMPEVYSWKFAAYYRWLQRALARRGVRIATVSSFAQKQIASHLNLDPDTIKVVGEGAEHLLRYDRDPGLLSTLGLCRPYVLSVGSFARHKNLIALQATAARLAERGMDLVLIGDANPRVFADPQNPLPPSVRWIGRHGDPALRTLYAGASCFVFPSLDESFGLPAVEAMACRCPVVAARAGSLPEICAEAALLVDPTQPAEFAEQVLRVIDSPEAADRLRASGEARAAGFTWPAAAARLAMIADDIGAGDSGRPAA